MKKCLLCHEPLSDAYPGYRIMGVQITAMIAEARRVSQGYHERDSRVMEYEITPLCDSCVRAVSGTILPGIVSAGIAGILKGARE